jgi:hypothetical protein
MIKVDKILIHNTITDKAVKKQHSSNFSIIYSFRISEILFQMKLILFFFYRKKLLTK